jgi:hypothetical protein
MIRWLCCLAVLTGGASAIADPPPDALRPAGTGYSAEIEVLLGGVPRHGRIIVTPDGCVFLEHLDEEARRWVGTILNPERTPIQGWDDRNRSRRSVWVQVGGNMLPAEVHAAGRSLRISEHRLLTAR